MLHIYHTFCGTVDNGKEVRVLFCDISKAFDRVWQKGLLYKFAAMGISDYFLRWFTRYLKPETESYHWWYCIWLGVHSCRCHPSSILGPLLFFIYIGDIHSSIRLFAQDTSLYIVVENPQSAAHSPNIDFKTINKWANSWLTDFNPTKTTSLLISRKLNPVTHPPLRMNNAVLTETSKTKTSGSHFQKLVHMGRTHK